MKKLFTVLSFALTVFMLASCSALTGEEIGRLPINAVSKSDSNMVIKELALDLKAGEEIAIWSEMDIEYEGETELRFRMDVFKDGEGIQSLEINPTEMNVTIGEVKTGWMGKTEWSFSGKNGSFPIEEDGKYEFKAILVASDNPTLVLRKAEVVFKK